MLDLRGALEKKQISDPVQQVVLSAAARTACQPLDRSRDGKSVPCVAEQGTQVALYPMKHRIAIAMTRRTPRAGAPASVPGWSTRAGARPTCTW